MDAIARYDNWGSTLSALGSVKDKSAGANFRRRARLSRQLCETLVDQNALCARAVEKHVSDAFRAGWKFKGEDLELFRARLEAELDLSARVREAVRWSRMYGGCLLYMSVGDRRDAQHPLNMSGVQSIAALNPIPAHQCEPHEYDSAFGSATYRQVLSYRVEPIGGSDATRVVHASRCVVFEPISLPIESRIEGLNSTTWSTAWGPSVTQRFYDELIREGSTRAYANAMMYVASILAIKMQGLRDQISTDEGKRIVRGNLEVMRQSMDGLGIAGLDAQDDLVTVQHGVAGLADMVSTARDALASALPFPREIGLNESPTGLRGGELSGAQALYFADVEAMRTDILTPALLRVARVAAAAWGVDLSGGGAEIEWSPLWVPDEREQSETAARNATTDRTYWEIQALGAREIRDRRFVDGQRGALTVEPEHAGDVRKSTPYLEPALRIVESVAAGTIPRDAGAQLLIAGGYSPLLLGSAGAPSEPLITTMAHAAEGSPDDDPAPEHTRPTANPPRPDPAPRRPPPE
jgi:phage-related protein (TIGR01555 family)